MWKKLIYPRIGEYASDFLISDTGELKNIKTNHIYKLETLKSGYYSVRVSLGSSKRKKHIIIHKAVALTFIDNPNNYNVVNHIDGNKLNNSIDNLEWCTYGHNLRHSYENGLFDKSKISGENNHAHRLTKTQIEEIRTLYKPRSKDANSYTLGRKYGVSHTHILDIIKFNVWK